MVAKFLNLNNLSGQRQPFALWNDGRKVQATVLFLSAIFVGQRCEDPEILLPWQRYVTTSLSLLYQYKFSSCRGRGGWWIGMRESW